MIPFTPEEREAWELLLKATNVLLKLPDPHPSDKPDITNAVHKIQDILLVRVMRRNHPDELR